MEFDFVIVGGGIVGLATAMTLLRRSPGASLLLVDKESEVGKHQTGHNSGVIHTGIYYEPGSLKALLCRAGCDATKAFCDEEGIEYVTCGKLLVATSSVEMKRLAALGARARANGVDATELDAAALKELEPNVSGLGALRIPDAGIVDYGAVCRAMAARITRAGGRIQLGAEVRSITEAGETVRLQINGTSVSARQVVACAGLQSDRVARMAGIEPECRIVPVRGEYYALPRAKSDIVRHMIYPVPDPDLPFLGIHLTPTVGGTMTVGPNAVVGFAREGYGRFSFSLRDALAMAAYPGAWRLLGRYWRHALGEFANSLSRKRYLAECRKYCPSLETGDLQPWPAGIRAQAVARDGRLIHDFVFAATDRMLHVLNAPSPAATSAIPIAEMIADRLSAANERDMLSDGGLISA